MRIHKWRQRGRWESKNPKKIADACYGWIAPLDGGVIMFDKDKKTFRGTEKATRYCSQIIMQMMALKFYRQICNTFLNVPLGVGNLN